ncbi:hypothetical protein JD969_10560 [Planctomycetota bacterium]|nr:hypothetical protein JD969_10560 [Planctomycetota bacterium]
MRRQDRLVLFISLFLVCTFLIDSHANSSGGADACEKQIEKHKEDDLQWADFSDRVIEFSGYKWRVKGKEKEKRYGPGNNYFGSGEKNVHVDEAGRLHLKITYREGKWEAAEVALVDVLGHGLYEFRLDSRVDVLDPNVIFGLFLWEYQESYENAWRHNVANEFDLEFGIWKDKRRKPAQYVCQPAEMDNIHHFDLDLSEERKSTHSFEWTEHRMTCKSWYTHAEHPKQKQLITYWSYSGVGIPKGKPRVHLNFWPDREPPSDGEEHEVVITSFRFVPAKERKRPVEVETSSNFIWPQRFTRK